MPITRDEVRGIAEYARITLTPEELEQMTAYLNEAMRMLEPLRVCALEGVEPTYHPIGDLSNVMADDEVDAHGRSLALDAALRNAVSTQGRTFRVPSILGDGEVTDSGKSQSALCHSDCCGSDGGRL